MVSRLHVVPSRGWRRGHEKRRRARRTSGRWRRGVLSHSPPVERGGGVASRLRPAGVVTPLGLPPRYRTSSHAHTQVEHTPLRISSSRPLPGPSTPSFLPTHQRTSSRAGRRYRPLPPRRPVPPQPLCGRASGPRPTAHTGRPRENPMYRQRMIPSFRSQISVRDLKSSPGLNKHLVSINLEITCHVTLRQV